MMPGAYLGYALHLTLIEQMHLRVHGDAGILVDAEQVLGEGPAEGDPGQREADGRRAERGRREDVLVRDGADCRGDEEVGT